MTGYCYAHQSSMTERTSKTKKDENGNFKTYFAHIGPDGRLCFGIGKPPVGEYKETAEEINEMERDPDLKAIKESNRDWLEEDNEIEKGEPMTKEEKMWRDKEDRAAQREDKRNAEIRRMTLAKQYIGASVDFDSAVENGDLLKWDHWTKTGNLPGPHGEED